MVLVGAPLSVILQDSLAPSLSIFGGQPDFPLLLVCLCSLMARPAGGAAFGGWIGLLTGSLAGANLTHYVTTRAVTGFLSAWARDINIDFNVAVACVVAAVGVVIGQAGLLFFAPTPAIGTFIQATIISAIYNGVVAAPLYWVLRRFSSRR